MKSIIKSLSLVLCFIAFVAAIFAANLCGDNHVGAYDPSYSVYSVLLFAVSAVFFGLWVILEMFIKDNEINPDDLR